MNLEIGKWYELVGTPSPNPPSTMTQKGGIDIMLVQQDSKNNTSKIRVRPWVKKIAGSGTFNLSVAQISTFKIDEQTKKVTHKYDLRNQLDQTKFFLKDHLPFQKESGEGELLDGTYVFDFVIPHNENGKKEVSIYGFVALLNTGNGRNWIVDTKVELPSIQIESKVGCNSFYLGDSATISIESLSNHFVHTLEFVFPSINYSGVIATKTNHNTIIWDQLDFDYILKQIPEDRYIEGIIKCRTYESKEAEEPLGKETSCNFIANVKNLGVTLNSISIFDTNEATFVLTGSRTTIVKYMSKPKFTINATPEQYATIVSYMVSCGSKTIKKSTEELIFSEGIDINDWDLSVRDSRDFSSPIIMGWKFPNFIDYIKLGIIKFNLYREESTSTKLNIDISGIFFNGNFGVLDNVLTLQYRYKEKNGEYSEVKSLTLNSIENTFFLTQALEDVFDFNKQYDFEFVLSDKLMSVVTTIQVEGGESIVRIAEKWIVNIFLDNFYRDICCL